MVWQLLAVYPFRLFFLIKVSRRCHVDKTASSMAGQSVLEEVIIVDAVEQHGEHSRANGKAANAEQAVDPVAADIPPGGFKIMV